MSSRLSIRSLPSSRSPQASQFIVPPFAPDLQSAVIDARHADLRRTAALRRGRARYPFREDCIRFESPGLSGFPSFPDRWLMSLPSRAATADDEPLSLPPSASIRWLASHKAAVIIAIRAGAISSSEACQRYRLSHEELTAWETAFDRYGPAALQV